MKPLIMLATFLLCGTILQAQQMDSLFIVTYTTGPLWDHQKVPGAQPYFADHSAHMMKLMKDGTTKVGARYADKGIIIVTAATLKMAKEIVNLDPAVINELFEADVQKLNVFFPGCIEKL